MENLTADIVGQWQLVRVIYQHMENGEIIEQATDNSPAGNTVVFNADGTGTYDEEMTWELSGDEIFITDDYGTDRLRVEYITADGLELTGYDHFEDIDVTFDDHFRDTYKRI